MSCWKRAVLAFDTETTGLGKDARIIEIALVQYVDGVEVDSWSTFLEPEGVDWNSSMVKKALEVNHITREDLRGAPRFADVFKDLMARFRKCPVWVAHNTPFDARMLKQERMRLPDRGRILVPLGEHPMPKLLLDTLALDVALNPSARGRRLDAVASRWEVVPGGAHRAVVDARTCGDVLQRMMPLLPDDIVEMEALFEGGTSIWERRVKYAKAHAHQVDSQ